MPSHGSSSPDHQQQGTKRKQPSSDKGASDGDSHRSPSHQLAGDAVLPKATAAAVGKAGQSSNFRNVSACNRCRLRKNRCDQRLPSCASCAKAGVACVGHDPITKKEIPRSYVFYLETRVEQLETLLMSNSIPFSAAENLELCSRPSVEAQRTVSHAASAFSCQLETVTRANAEQHQVLEESKVKKASQSAVVANATRPRRTRPLASASGVSFARVVFAAVQYSMSEQTGTNERTANCKPSAGASIRDSFSGLHTSPTIQPAPFPEKQEGMRLAMLYFEHANPQIPILHRVDFMQTLDRAYEDAARELTAQELYMMNMVFAIGSGVILGEPVKTLASIHPGLSLDRPKSACQPEEYHASAIVHLEECLGTSGCYLEVLQAVLLLASFALLRPVPPGLWYITGVAVRLAVDLGLHHEDGIDVDANPTEPRAGSGAAQAAELREGVAQDRGRRLWIRDLRRRLWWCTYSFDRLVSTCVGRPFGVSDEIITTELPSLLDDECITRRGFEVPPDGGDHPSYKHVAHHYFRLRLLQSEIVQVLQYNQAQLARATSSAPCKGYPEMRPHLPSPFLVQFDSFRSWRADMERRLFQWKTSAPTKEQTGVSFAIEFLELNYWQVMILLHRQSLSVPAMFEGEYNLSDQVNSPSSAFAADLGEDEDHVYVKVAEAGQKILRIYRQLHLSGLVSYPYLSTHHLFMAGISYLYAIWHSALTMDEVDFTVLAAKSVFSDMIEKCPPAETCRDAFDRTSKATMKMAGSNGGFGASCQQPQRQTRGTTSCTSVSDWALLMNTPSRHRYHLSGQAPFHFDPFKALKGDAIMSGQPRSARSDVGPSQRMSQGDASSSIDPSLIPSPHGPPSTPSTCRQFGFPDCRRYPDAQKLASLGSLDERATNSELGSADEENNDAGFGVSWDGLHNEFREGQLMDPFDTFFFGGQPGGGKANSGSGSGSGSIGNRNGDND
ncbi:hypothetical protein E4U42_004226 [Claviceps africana]|uniref:Zn(2)-C6 fungal-type domain-containing protein n=1 Tax=Claviceps africana TaxID=83212 RepID=A0A8K0NKZ0_9HYPO|nr:hypothetical protein E4U42_004226 [Claviceps africana]